MKCDKCGEQMKMTELIGVMREGKDDVMLCVWECPKCGNLAGSGLVEE